MRIFSIQATNSKSDIQLKILQMNLQFANIISQDPMSAPYLTETILRDMVGIPLLLCDGKCSISVTHSAIASANQIIGLIMNGVCEVLSFHSNSPRRGTFDLMSEQASASVVVSAQLLVRDLAFVSTGAYPYSKNYFKQSDLKNR